MTTASHKDTLYMYIERIMHVIHLQVQARQESNYMYMYTVHV